MQPCTIAVVVAKDGQLSGLCDGLFTYLLLPARDKVEYEFGNVGVITDNDENGRGDAARTGFGVPFPKAVILLVVAVQTKQRSLQFDGKLGFALNLVCFTSLFGEVVADAEPQVPVGGVLTR